MFTIDAHLDLIRWLQFLDGGLRARSHGDSSIITWDLTTGRPVNYIDLGGLGGLTLSPTPDGRSIIACDDTGRFRVWALP